MRSGVFGCLGCVERDVRIAELERENLEHWNSFCASEARRVELEAALGRLVYLKDKASPEEHEAGKSAAWAAARVAMPSVMDACDD